VRRRHDAWLRGPRQTGKTTLLHAAYPDAFWIDLLKADEYRRYLNPEILRGELNLRASVRQVVIDEVQKVPALLDEVHWRPKVKRGQANLLGRRKVQSQREDQLQTIMMNSSADSILRGGGDDRGAEGPASLTRPAVGSRLSASARGRASTFG